MKHTAFHRCAAMLLVSLLPATGALGAVCGPGAHWVDTCPAGTDSFQSSATFSGNAFGMTFTNLTLNGPTTVYRGAGQVTPAAHYFDTEMVSLQLSNGVNGPGAITVTAGDGVGNLLNDGLLYSPGRVTEQAGNPFLADSFFDVFFELDIDTGSGILQAWGTENMGATGLPSVPPPNGTAYMNPQIIPLYDNPQQIGQPVGQLNAATHTVMVPEADTYALLLAGLGLLGFMARRRKQQAA